MSITPTNKDQAKGRRFAGCFFGVFMIFGLAMSVMFLWPLVEITQASNWRPTPCTILTSQVASHSGSKGGSTYSVEVTYRYMVDDTPYVGTRYKFMSGSSSGYDGKKEIVDGLRPGTQTTCYVSRRNPGDAVIERGFTGDIFFGCIPLVFAAIGAGGLFGVFIYKGKKRLTGVTPGLPAVKQTSTSRPGATTLRAGSARIGKFIFALIFGLIWNGVVSVFLVQCWSGWSRGHGDGCATAFLVPFLLVGVGVIVLTIYFFLGLFNPSPTLKLSSPSVALGDDLEVEWETTGNVDRVKSFSITLEGREEATYKRGTSTSTDKAVFASIELVTSNKGRELRRGKAKLVIPADTMHTFLSRNNKIVWNLKVKGDIPMWPDIGDEYSLEILPRRIPPGGPA
jgi:hypothetical protein